MEKTADRTHALSRPLLERLHGLGQKLAERKGRRLKIMEVCGTHTVAYARTGISDLVSPYIDLHSGPGCPICVTHQDDLDRVFSLARHEDTLIVTFGDLLRVPGSRTTLEREMARGGRVQVCYSPLEAVARAARNPGDRVVLIAIGFETTAPAMAAALQRAARERLDNFWLYPLLKRVPPALTALLENPLALDGFLLPGHVAAVLGSRAFSFLGGLGFPSVVTGFEPLDLLLGLYTLLKNMEDGRTEVGNAYSHVVREEGNTAARRLMAGCFAAEPLTRWRGLGAIPESGYTLREPYSRYNARLHFDMEMVPAGENPHCACGRVIAGRSTPFQCPLFGRGCTPSTPVGPCMVAPEGACGAYYHYR